MSSSTSSISSTQFTVKALVLKPQFKTQRQAFNALDNLAKGNAKRKQQAVELREQAR